MQLRFIDFEVYPNWWCCTFGDYPEDDTNLNESIKDSFVVVQSTDIGCRDKFLRLIKADDVCIVGYNIKGYDLMIANGVYQGFTPQQLKIINDLIINPGCRFATKEHIRLSSFAKKRIPVKAYQELMDDSNGCSLKDCEAIMGLDIRETEVPFDKEDLTPEEIDSIIYYNKHDVYSSMIFHKLVKKNYTDSKLTIGRVFGIDEATCYKKTNANLCSIVLDAKYSTFGDEFEYRVVLPPSIREYIYDAIPSKIVDAILNNPYNFDKDGKATAKTLQFELFGETVVFGNGGLHSILCNNLYVESNDEWVLMNADVGSFYPALMINFDTLSRAISSKEKYRNIRDTRIYLKHKKDKTPTEKEQVDAFKLVLNTVFGASGNKYLPLYDKYMCLTTCRIGQVVLASLGCNLYKKVPDLRVIQTNTDGILLYFRRRDMNLVQKVCDEFMKVMGLDLEFDEELKVWQRDVNNYLMVNKKWDGTFDWTKAVRYGDEIKLCGEWLQNTWHRPGYPHIGTLSSHCAPKACIEYLLCGRSIVKTILNNKYISDFCIFAKKGPTFRKIIQRMADGTEVTLNRANRIYASKDKSLGPLYKVKYRLDKVSYNSVANQPDHPRLINEDLSHVDFDKIRPDIDYAYYVEQACELLNIDWVDPFGNPVNNFKYE